MNLKEKITASFTAPENQGEIAKNALFGEKKLAAFNSFKQQDFPTTKNEDWKYTNLKSLLKNNFELFPNKTHTLQEKDIKKYLLIEESSINLVFVNGFFDENLSTNLQEISEINTLSSIATQEKSQAEFKQLFETTESIDNCFVNLNNAFLSDGVFINIPKGKAYEPVIQILYLTHGDAEASMFQAKNLVFVGENSQVKIIESHYNLSENKSLTNSFTEIYAGKSALVAYHKIQNDQVNASLIDHTYVHQKSKSEVSLFTLSLGGDLTRNNLVFNHQGEHINSNLYGVSILNKSQHVDNNTLINHQQPNCESNECYKGIYAENSTGVFNGKVYVHREAQKTNAYQQNDNILLDNTATINAKPQLEIFADDVKCSHGCTMGELDNDALFYLKTRGIPENDAKKLLLYAFANEAVENIKIPSLKKSIAHLIDEKLDTLS
jgi:Fe-S cluster assembly protein SufD